MKIITREQFEDIWFDPNRTIVEKEYTNKNQCVYKKVLIENNKVIAQLLIQGDYTEYFTCE